MKRRNLELWILFRFWEFSAAFMAQLVERSAVNRQVLGSIPSEGAFFLLEQTAAWKEKKLLVGESNPGRPRDRRKCYQLHQPGPCVNVN